MEFKDYFSSIKNLNNILNNFFEQIPEELNFPPNKNIEVPKKWRNENKSNLLHINISKDTYIPQSHEKTNDLNIITNINFIESFHSKSNLPKIEEFRPPSDKWFSFTKNSSQISSDTQSNWESFRKRSLLWNENNKQKNIISNNNEDSNYSRKILEEIKNKYLKKNIPLIECRFFEEAYL